MPKKNVTFFVDTDGKLSVEDPSPLEARILKRLGVNLCENPHGDDQLYYIPNRTRVKQRALQYPLPENVSSLLSLHDTAVKYELLHPCTTSSEAFPLLNVKRKLLAHYLQKCRLCGYKCNGAYAASGACPIGKSSYYYQHYVHVGEEKEIGRTLVIELTGCNIRCAFCQKGELIQPDNSELPRFTGEVWKKIEKEYKQNSFNSISFLGGNPDQSLSGAFDFLETTPDWASHLPIVWHTNGYSSPQLYNLLWGLVDTWVFDFKYFSDQCAISLSSTPDYVDTAKKGLTYLTEISNLPVLVRHLILPGHWKCCQKPLIQWLQSLRGNVILNPMAQYRPVWQIAQKDKRLLRTVTQRENERVINFAENTGIILTSSVLHREEKSPDNVRS